jgi:thioredoxin reductase (NADPH)
MRIRKLGVIAAAAAMIVVGCYWWYTKTSRLYVASQVEQKSNIIPIAIIGGGPSGLSAAMYGARAGFHTVVFQGREPGGQLMSTSYIENWPGVTRDMGPKVMERVAKQAEEFGVVLVPETVEQIDIATWPFRIKIQDGPQVYALSVVLATGATPRKLGVPGEQQYWGKGVMSCPKCDAPFTKDKRVLIVGGGDTAVEYALQIAPYASDIVIAMRREEGKASAHMLQKLDDHKHIQFLYNKKVTEVVGDDKRVVQVKLIDATTQEAMALAIDWVFLAIGHDPNTSLVKGKLPLDAHGCIKVACRSQKTSVPGIFAAGNVADPVYRQAVTGSGDGGKAGLDAVQFLFSLDIDVVALDKKLLYGLASPQSNGIFLPDSQARE